MAPRVPFFTLTHYRAARSSIAFQELRGRQLWLPIFGWLVTLGLALWVNGDVLTSTSPLPPFSIIVSLFALFMLVALTSVRLPTGILLGLHPMTALVAAGLVGFRFSALTMVGASLLAMVLRVLFMPYMGISVRFRRAIIAEHLGNWTVYTGSLLLSGLMVSRFLDQTLIMGTNLEGFSFSLWLIGLYAVINEALNLLGLLNTFGLDGSLQHWREYWRLILTNYGISVIAAPSLLIGYFLLTDVVWLVILGFGLGSMLVNSQNRAYLRMTYRVDDLRLLNKIGQALSRELDEEALFEMIYREVGNLLDVSGFHVALYDPQTGFVSFPILMIDGERLEHSDRTGGKGLTEHVIQRGQPLLLPSNITKYAISQGLNLADVGSEGKIPCCFAGVPMIAGTETLGVISLANYEQRYLFSQEDIHLLEAIATQAATAIQNARLYQQGIRQASELSSLNVISTLVSSSLDMNEVIETICTAVVDMLGAQKAAVFLVDPDNQRASIVGSIGLSPGYVAESQNLDLETHPRLSAMREARALIAQDIRTMRRFNNISQILDDEKIVGIIEIPMLIGRKVIGSLTAYYSEPALSSPREVELLSTLAGQMAVAVENARLFEATRKRQEELSVLYDVSRELSGTLALNRILEIVTLSIVRVLDARCGYALTAPTFDAQYAIQVGVCLNDAGDAQIVKDLPVWRGNPVHPDNTGNRDELVIISRSSTDGQEVADLLDTLNESQMVLVPLLVQRDQVGLIAVSLPDRQQVLSEDQQRLALALARHGGVVIQNARLFEYTEVTLANRLEEISALEKVSQRMARRLDFSAVIEQVVLAASEATRAEFAEVILADEDKSTLTVVARHGAYNDDNLREWPINDGVTGRALRSGEVQLIANTLEDPDFIHGQEGILSELAVPIILDDRRLGLINLESRIPDFFNPDQARFIANLAEHAAVTIQNARLFETIQRRANEFNTLRRIAVDLISAADLDRVLLTIAQSALEHTGASNSHIYLYDARTDTLSFGASVWASGEVNREFQKPRPEGLTYSVAHSGEAFVIRDPVHHPLFAENIQKDNWELKGIVGLPLKRGDEVIGVFNCSFAQAEDLNEEALRFLDLLTSQAAVAIAGAQLTAERQASRDRLQAILDSNYDGIMLFDKYGYLQLANPRLEWLLNVRAEQYIGQHYTTIIGSLEQTEITTEPIFSLPSVMDVIAQIDDNPYEITRRTYLLQEPALRSIEEISSPVSNSDNQLIGRIFVLRDTTNAFELERYREELSGMLVHDLRSPLGGVIAGLHMAIEEMELGRDQADEALIMTTMRVALNSANRLLNMVTNLLDIYKLEAGELRLKTEPLKLADIAAHAVDILRSVALEAEVHVGVKAPNNLSRVIADVQIIERVLINLLDNALRYTPEQGYVTVQVRRQGDQQIVSVLDSGSGIPPESRADVFKRHVQLQTGRRVRGAKGSGLGLTFCKLAVESHGGKIWVDDGPEGGAAFHFSLPIKGPSSARHPESLSA